MKNSHITIIKNYLKSHERITTSDAFTLFKKHRPEIKRSTVNWHLYELVQRGVIKRAGRGIYVSGEKDDYCPSISRDIQTMSELIHSSFPLISYCIWSTDQIKGFAQHIPALSYTLIEVESDGVTAVLNTLKEKHEHVYNGNSKTILKEILPDLDKAILVKTLVSEAPIKFVYGVPTPTLEKILVDIFSDSELFDYLQGNELVHIFSNILDGFTINTTRLSRYAARRGKRKNIHSFLEQIIGNKTN